MDERDFDALARSLAAVGSRRQALKALFGLAGLGVALGLGHPANAARRGYGGPSIPDPGNEVCFGYFCGQRTSSLQCPCPSDDWCINGACVLPCDPSRPGPCGDCIGCRCASNVAQTAVSCMDSRWAAGACYQDSDCPAGSYCSAYPAGGGDKSKCVYPCCIKL